MKFRARTNEKRQLEVRWELVNTYLSRWKPGTLLELEIKRRQKKRVDPQRRWYFGEILPALMAACGYDPEDKLYLHRHLKILYFGVEPDKKGMYLERDIPSVFSDEPTVNNEQRTKFVDWVLRKAAENGAYIDDPTSKN